MMTTFQILRWIIFLSLTLLQGCSQTTAAEKEILHGDHNTLPLDDGHVSGQEHSIEYSSCICDHHRIPSSSSSSSSNANSNINDNLGGGARIFYLVGIHNNRTLHDAVYLFRAIRDKRNIIVFHLDIKFGLDDYEHSLLKQEVEECPCGSHIEIASVHNATWSSWSMNLPTLWAIEKAVSSDYKNKWDVFINLSGDTLPVYTSHRIANLFAGPLKNINFITSSACATGLKPTPIHYFPKHWHKRSHYSYKPASLNYVDDDGNQHYNQTIETHFGSQWMALLPTFCDFLVKQLSRDDSLASQFKHYLKRSGKLMTDETFIPTVLMHYFPETISNITSDELDDGITWLDSNEIDMHAIRYERMDEHVPDSKGWFPTQQRYEVPSSSGVDVPKPWGPYFLGVYDLANIKYSGALYIRKVATAIDENLFRLLPVDHPNQIPDIDWPIEVKVCSKPNWEKKLAGMREKHKRELESKHAKEQAKETVSDVIDSIKKVDRGRESEKKDEQEPLNENPKHSLLPPEEKSTNEDE